MSTFGTTYQSYQAKGLREDLENVIYDISPTDTPVMSNAGRTDVKQTLHEWQTDVLAAAVTDNAQIEGDDIAAIPALTPTVRYGNYTQISRKLAAVSGTMESIDKAGRAGEMAYQLAKLAKELKRDIETSLTGATAGAAGNASTARSAAGLNAFIKTNVSLGSGGGNPAYTSGVPLAARTDGTQRDFTEVLFKAAAQLVWASGGSLKMAMAGPVNKQNISVRCAGIATKSFDWSKVAAMPVIGAVDIYVSDFGNIQIATNRFQRDRDVWFLDPEMMKMGYLRPFQTVPLAKTGDAEKRMLLVEWTFVIGNEKAHGLLADLNTSILTAG